MGFHIGYRRRETDPGSEENLKEFWSRNAPDKAQAICDSSGAGFRFFSKEEAGNFLAVQEITILKSHMTDQLSSQT